MVLPDSTQAQLPTLNAGFVPPKNADPAHVARDLLSAIADCITGGEGDALAGLFIEYGYWRDILAFTREFHTFKTGTIAQVGNDVFPTAPARDFVLTEPAPKLETPFPDLAFVRAHFGFSADLGPAHGTFTAVYCEGTGTWKLWTLSTQLEGIHGLQQAVGDQRPYGRHNDVMPYDSRREMEAAMEGEQPDLLVVGAGHNGLVVAALARSYGLNPLVVDREERVGDNWRKRYSSLSLHDPVVTNHLPLLPFPRTWPLFTSAGKLANWLEYYADIMELNVWLRSTTDPARTAFNSSTGMWEVTVLRTNPDGSTKERVLRTSHVVLATGLGGGRPRIPPPFPGQESWKGEIVHSSQHRGGKGLAGKKVLVVGACTSAFDISGDLANNGAHTTILQRSPTFIMSLTHGIHMLTGGLYNNAIPTEVADHIAAGTPRAVTKLFHQRMTAWLKEQDADLLAGLENKGFETYSGPEDAGFMFLAMEKGGGYYFDTGTCSLISSGQIKIRRGEIASFDSGNRITFTDGTSEDYDLVVLATGYTGYKDSVASVLGQKYADMMTALYGIDAEGEMNGIARDVGIPNMFFHVGNLASSRLFGKAIVLQILAQKRGVWTRPYYRPGSEVQGSTTGGYVFPPEANGVVANGA